MNGNGNMRMGPQTSKLTAQPWGKTLLALTPAILLTSIVTLSNPDALIASTFESAFSDVRLEPRSVSRVAEASISGSEEFWLSRASGSEAVKAVSWTAPVAPGDHITVKHGGIPRVYQVISVDALDNDSTRIQTSAAAGRQFVVACRDAAKADETLVRFTIDGNSRGVTVVAPADQAL